MGVTFLHAADLHLDRPFKGLSHVPESLSHRIRQSTFTAFQQLITAAVEHKVDFVVIAGDLFDGHHPSLRAQRFAQKQFQRLAKNDISVYLVLGNHDFGLHQRLEQTFPENVHVFPEDVSVQSFQKEGTTVHLYGFSYPERHLKQRKIDTYEKVDHADFHIGILHGYHEDGQDDHDVYAPFHLQDLLDKQFDYWALGHIHQRQMLHDDPPVCYPGSSQGLSIKETGEKGAHIVNLDHQYGAAIQWLPVHDVQWTDPVVDVSQIQTAEQLSEHLEQIKEQLRQPQTGVLARITLTGASPIKRLLLEPYHLQDLLDTLHEGEEEAPDFVWILDCHDAVVPEYDREALKNTNHFLGDLVRLRDTTETIDDWLEPLYQHKRAGRYLASLNQQEQQEVLDEAEAWLIEQLSQAGEGGALD
ncbi:metallophosphoesterase family protein [Tuberibacillus sp. Marseille-P3662]|uniref:metallophosphoesterase family protein n=1 Tax=Tuberibacillus sp. Marseille-P3662 TaxID=1965358 RepID=UPI000A1CA85E|nr:DNA repair exonuclease [Tuberibacillus sp. Marseille-P3662]